MLPEVMYLEAYEGYKNNWLKKTTSTTHTPGQRSNLKGQYYMGIIVPGPNT